MRLEAHGNARLVGELLPAQHQRDRVEHGGGPRHRLDVDVVGADLGDQLERGPQLGHGARERGDDPAHAVSGEARDDLAQVGSSSSRLRPSNPALAAASMRSSNVHSRSPCHGSPCRPHIDWKIFSSISARSRSRRSPRRAAGTVAQLFDVIPGHGVDVVRSVAAEYLVGVGVQAGERVRPHVGGRPMSSSFVSSS